MRHHSPASPSAHSYLLPPLPSLVGDPKNQGTQLAMAPVEPVWCCPPPKQPPHISFSSRTAPSYFWLQGHDFTCLFPLSANLFRLFACLAHTHPSEVTSKETSQGVHPLPGRLGQGPCYKLSQRPRLFLRIYLILCV